MASIKASELLGEDFKEVRDNIKKVNGTLMSFSDEKEEIIYRIDNSKEFVDRCNKLWYHLGK